MFDPETLNGTEPSPAGDDNERIHDEARGGGEDCQHEGVECEDTGNAEDACRCPCTGCQGVYEDTMNEIDEVG